MPAVNINFVTKKSFNKSLTGKILRWGLTYGRYIIVVTEIIVLLAFFYRFSLDRKITDLSDEIKQKSAIIQANSEFEEQFRILQRRTTLVNQLFNTQKQPLDILNQLQQIVPQGIYFTNYSYAQNQINIAAMAQTNLSLTVFLNKLKSSGLFSDIKLGNVSKQAGGKTETQFKVTAVLKQTAENQTNNTKKL